MQLHSSNTTEQKLKSLSKRLKYFSHDYNSALSHTDKNVKSANLQLNLSLVLSKIILELHFIDRSKSVFENIIEEYNNTNNVFLTFDDFERINWIRVIAGEAILPRQISRFVLEVSRYEKEAKPIEIPIGKNDLIRCLQIYYERCFQDSQPTISKKDLEQILSKFALKELTIDFLFEIDVIRFGSEADIYYWNGGEYVSSLNNEIASTLWLLISGGSATDVQFRKYFKLIQGAEVWFDNLSTFLNYENTEMLSELAVDFLANENDLIKSEAEFSKIWLDTELYNDININSEIPIVEFNYNNAFDFIESVCYHKWRFHDTFDYQKTRRFCNMLLRIIVLDEQKSSSPYQSVLNILKDTSKPFLLWTLYSDIKLKYPFVIPYLLTDSELLPIAFKLIDKIEIDNLLLSEQSNNDRKFEESFEVKNQFWFEMFELTLEQIISVHSKDKEKGELIAKILIDVSEKVFSINSNNRNSFINHNAFRKRYDIALIKLANKKITIENIYPKLPISPRLIHSLLPDIANYLKEKTTNKKPNHTEHLNLNHGFVDLSIEMLRLANLRVSEFEISADGKIKLDTSSKEIITLLQNAITEFYSATEIDVQLYDSIGTEKRKVKRGVNSFGFEIIDWGYLYLHFEKENTLKRLYDNFITSLTFKTDADKYHEHNKEQNEKIRLYLKSLMLAFISINQKKDIYEIEGLPVTPTLEKLENWIGDLSLKYSIDEIAQKRIDVFNEMFHVFGYDIYYQQLTNLLYKSINYFKNQHQNKFVQSFFAESKDIGRMLTAINMLDSKELGDIISNRINTIDIQDFIALSFTTTELQYALVEAINSDNHWELAKPLIEKIQNHFNKVNHNQENINNLLFEISLLLSFKEKDLTKLTNIPIPKSANFYMTENKKAENVHKFYIGLYNVYQDKKYNEAIPIFKSLLSHESKNIRYAFHLYRAETLKNRTNLILLNRINQDWKNFVDSLSDEEKKELSEYSEAAASNSLHYLIATKDNALFDQTINNLSKRYLYDEEIIPTVYNFYVERELHEFAYEYLRNAEEYFTDNGKAIPAEIKTLIDNSQTTNLLRKLRKSLEKILTLNPKNISSISPENINDKRELNEFILHEFILASRVLLDKIHSIKQISHEDRFNDLFIATLRLRFPFWGWTIIDQPRIGSSATGVSAGEVDILIQATGQSIALIEALILKSGDYKNTSEHILKCFQYVSYLSRYYIIVYFRGPAENFDATWTVYTNDVLKIPFPKELAISTTHNFISLLDKFDDVRHLKIAKTIHSSNVEIFHLMINLGV